MAQTTAWLTGAWYRAGAALARQRLKWQRPVYRHEVRRWLVLQSGANPSTDYYIRPRAVASGVPAHYVDIEDDMPTDKLSPGTLVIVVRYLNGHWSDILRRNADHLAGVVYFMDDDLLDPTAWRGLPSHYHDKLARHFAAAGHDIAGMTSQLWVSTSELASRYAAMAPEVMPPMPLVDDEPRVPAQTRFVRLFYHGTQAHEAEMRWLRPVVAACLDACPHAHFEVIGNHAVNAMYRDLPRTRVLHPMSWPNYVQHCRTMTGHIGLAPLLGSHFNAGRSATKVLDIARCGAIGVYTKAAPFDSAVRHGVDGWLVPNEPQLWVEQIIAMLNQGNQLVATQQHAAHCLGVLQV